MAGSFWLFALFVLSLVNFSQGCPGPDSARTITFPPGFFRNDTLHHKRWAGIIPGDGTGLLAITANTNANPWPQGVIRACIDPNLVGDRRDEAVDALLKGMQVWYTAGLPRRAWRAQVLTPEQCSAQDITGPKANFLWVRWAGRTPSGQWVYPTSSLGNTNSGSVLNFQTREYIAANTPSGATALARELNFDHTHAHEIGHLFGLVHEHQHPFAWPIYHGGVHPRNGLIQFHCENLRDYDACLAERTTFRGNVQQAREDLTNFLCVEQLDALTMMCQGGQPAGGVYDPTRGDHMLSSYEFLPFPGGSSFIQHSESTVDWRSIMMYGSHSGAKALGMPVFIIRSDENQEGSPGTDPENPQHVLPGLDGIFGTTMNRPTTRDIFGAYQMSEAVLPVDVDGLPYFSPGSPYNSIWAGEKSKRFGTCVLM